MAQVGVGVSTARSANEAQLKHLHEYMKKNPWMATSNRYVDQLLVANEWQSLTNCLNGYGPCKKNIEQWKQTWKDQQKKLKREAARQVEAAIITQPGSSQMQIVPYATSITQQPRHPFSGQPNSFPQPNSFLDAHPISEVSDVKSIDDKIDLVNYGNSVVQHIIGNYKVNNAIQCSSSKYRPGNLCVAAKPDTPSTITTQSIESPCNTTRFSGFTQQLSTFDNENNIRGPPNSSTNGTEPMNSDLHFRYEIDDIDEIVCLDSVPVKKPKKLLLIENAEVTATALTTHTEEIRLLTKSINRLTSICSERNRSAESWEGKLIQSLENIDASLNNLHVSLSALAEN